MTWVVFLALAIQWPDVIADDREAMYLWRQLRPTGTDAWDQARSIPETLQEDMARAILRDGHFDCPTQVSSEYRCSPDWLEFVPADKSQEVDNPCVRRTLAEWAISVLESDDLVAMPEACAAIATLPYPEEALITQLLQRIDDVSFKLHLIELVAAQADDRSFVLEEIGNRLEPAEAVLGAAELHVDTAVVRTFLGEDYPVDDVRRIGLAAIADAQLEDDTRAYAIEEMSARFGDDKRLRRALRAATKDARCRVAGAALGALSRLDDTKVSLALPKKHTPATFSRRLCEVYFAGGDVDALLRKMTRGKPLRLRDKVVFYDLTFLESVTTADLSDGDPDFGQTGLLAACQDGDCVGYGKTTFLRFHLDEGKPKKRRLVEIEYVSLDSTCEAPPPTR